MRAELLNAWPGLSMHFGVHPWDVGRFTPRELEVYLEALEQIGRDAKAAREKAERMR